MKALVYLCQKSITIREKEQKKIAKAEEDKDAEKGVIYDEDDADADGNLGIELGEEDDDESDQDLEDEEEAINHLYDTKLDKIDEVLLVQEQLEHLQGVDNQQWQKLLGALNDQERNNLL